MLKETCSNATCLAVFLPALHSDRNKELSMSIVDIDIHGIHNT